MNRKQWNQKYQVRRLMTGGKWGFMKESDRVDMSQYVYATQRQAAAARTLSFRVYKSMEAAEAAKEAELEKVARSGGVE